MGGEGGREGGRESNRCVNAFLLECTVYHKTHTHTTWSPQLIILGFSAGFVHDNGWVSICTCTLVHERFLAYVFTCRTYVVLSVSSDVHTHTFTCTHSPHSHTQAATT